MNTTLLLPSLKLLTASGDRASLIEAAMLLVCSSFSSQRRYGDKCPMAAHSMRVGLKLERFGDKTITVLGGFGHDFFEDTETSPDVISDLFGTDLTRLILACSHDVKLYERDEAAANEDLFQRAEAHGSEAIRIKIVDVTDNLATAHEVPRDWTEEMLTCAERWRILGHRYLGETAPHCVALARRISQVRM